MTPEQEKGLIICYESVEDVIRTISENYDIDESNLIDEVIKHLERVKTRMKPKEKRDKDLEEFVNQFEEITLG